MCRSSETSSVMPMINSEKMGRIGQERMGDIRVYNKYV